MPFEIADTVASYPEAQLRKLEWAVFVPTQITQLQIENCIDLRLHDTRTWMQTMLTEGRFKNTIYGSRPIGIHRGPAIDRVPEKLVESQLKHFENRNVIEFQPNKFWQGGYADDWGFGLMRLMPYLLVTTLGGSPILDTLARYLRRSEAGALIFPSARCDSKATIVGGNLEGWSGWNLVRYQMTLTDDEPFQIINEPESWASEMIGHDLKIGSIDLNSVGSFRLTGRTSFTDQSHRSLIENMRRDRPV